MKKHAGTLIGAICIFLFAQSGYAGIDQPQLAEKGSKAKSKSKIQIDGCGRGTCCTPGPTGATGPTGPSGATGSGFTEAYASAFQLEDLDLGEKDIGDVVQLPFTTMDYSKDITLDSSTDTFTLPKGEYLVDFHFIIDDDSKYAFDRMYLDIGGSEVNVAWAPGAYEPDDPNDVFDNSLASFSGSTIFDVPDDDTQVQFFIRINRKEKAGAKFIFKDPNSTHNYPTRIVFRKLGEVT